MHIHMYMYVYCRFDLLEEVNKDGQASIQMQASLEGEKAFEQAVHSSRPKRCMEQVIKLTSSSSVVQS